MITVNGCTWTDKNETMDLHELFSAKHGSDVAKPACQRCGNTTNYIVEEATVKNNGKWVKPIKKGLSFLQKFATLPMLIKDQKIYIPANICIDCAAREDAYIEFSAGRNKCPDLSTRNMTETEKERFRRIFALKISDLAKAAQEKSDQAIVGKARYALK